MAENTFFGVVGTELRGANDAALGQIQLGAWTAYTPALLASTTNPTLGTGSSATGRYVRIGRTVIGWAKIVFGTSGVAAGSGVYRVTLPFAAPLSGVPVGNGNLYNASTATNRTVLAGISFSTNAVEFGWTGSGTYWATDTTPWTWNPSDQIGFTFTYEAAS